MQRLVQELSTKPLRSFKSYLTDCKAVATLNGPFQNVVAKGQIVVNH